MTHWVVKILGQTEMKWNITEINNFCRKYEYKLTSGSLQTHIGGYMGILTSSAISRIMLMNKTLLLSPSENLLWQKHLWREVSTCHSNLFETSYYNRSISGEKSLPATVTSLRPITVTGLSRNWSPNKPGQLGRHKTKIRTGRPTNRGSISDMDKRYLSRPQWHWSPPKLLFNGYSGRRAYPRG